MPSRLNRRSFMARVVGASALGGGALSLVLGRSFAQTPLSRTCLTDTDSTDRPDYGARSGLTDTDSTDRPGRGTMTGRTDSDTTDQRNRGRSWRCSAPRPHYTGQSDHDTTDRGGYGRTGVTDSDSGEEADRAQYGRGGARPSTGVTDNDSGPNADRSGTGRGRGNGGVSDSDTGANADRAGYGRGNRAGETFNGGNDGAPRHAPGSALPNFPWPPPTPTTPPFKLAHARVLSAVGPHPTLGVVSDHLTAALDSQGYARSLYAAPNGFAIVAQLERIQPDGTPVPHSRFAPPNASAPFSLQDYVAGLFVAPVGFYRFIVLMVTNVPVVASGGPLSESGAGALLRRGADRLTEEVRRIPFGSDYEVTVLIYEFRKTGQGAPQPMDDSSVSARDHLERSGLYRAILPPG